MHYNGILLSVYRYNIALGLIRELPKYILFMVYFVCILYFRTLVNNSFHFIGFPEFGKSAERPGISASDFSGADLILTEISRNLLSSGPSYFDLYFAKVSARPSFPRAATRDGDPIVSRPRYSSSGFKFKDVCIQ